VRAPRVVALLVVASLGFFTIIGYRGVYLLRRDALTLRLLGAAVMVLVLLGAWVVVAEVRFGLATQRLATRLDAEGAPADDPPPRTPSGRLDRAAVDARFELCRIEVEACPADWHGWYHLACAYDAAGDRRRARSAMRQAIERSAQ
jgi:hypothetical protein